jgi:hypothetical protein
MLCKSEKCIEINRKRRIKLCCLQKSLANSKGFGFELLRTY